MKRLRETGVLGPTRVLTIERKLGLGENIFLVNATPRGAEVLPDIFHAIDTVYHNSPTYGRFNGYLVYSLYSLSSPRITRRILEELQKAELISDFFIFDIADFDAKPANYDYYNSTLGWGWDWSRWRDQIPKTLKLKAKFELPLDEVQPIVDFDTTDVLLLKHMFDDGDITQKKLAKILSLSEAQVNKRIKRLEDEKIIKGYRSTVSTTENELNLICFIELEKPQDQLLSVFYQLPYPATITMESRIRFAIQIAFNSQDMMGFLKGLDVLRPHLASCFVQTVHDAKMSMDSHPYDLYNEKTSRWETPGSEYLQDVQDVLKRE
ncbi:MAG: Lrp/AsnC family transcriptional regulator [Candidatus Thorarchaeota archaeon]|nr:Lrp/AsnC family transcriptional regulator [Candidatus Thorarchaeota archaeon]